MTKTITIAVTAKNEEASIECCLESLRASVRCAEATLPVRFDIVAVIDDCTDRTLEIVRSFRGIRTVESSGGIVEAQRKVAGSKPFVIFSDADILIDEQTVPAVCRMMLDKPNVQVAYPKKKPLPPQRGTLLAQALYFYNQVNGFQKPRRYFNGKFFAIRDWKIPTRAELEPRLSRIPVDRFYNFHAGMRVDDIYLSRDILYRYGPDAIHEVPDGEIYFRPPETFSGMYRTYHRMRLEIERLNLLFPETIPFHQQRGYDWNAVRDASLWDRTLWRIFRLALGLCIVRYNCEKFYYQRISSTPCPAWKPISETKTRISSDMVIPA